jgi:hypothetical protein
MKSRTRVKLTTVLISGGLSGCGLTVPQIGEFWDRGDPGDPNNGVPALTATALIEYEIKQKVYCELRYAVQQAQKIKVPRGLFIPDTWGVQLQLSLTVDESIALNPGASFTQYSRNIMRVFGVFPFSTMTNSVTIPQTFSLGFGGTLSRESLRTDKFNTYYTIKRLMQEETAICLDGKPDPEKDLFKNTWPPVKSSPLLIESNLGIQDWLIGAMYFDIALPSSSPQPSTASNGGGKFEGKFEGRFKGPLEGEAKGIFEGKTSSGGGGGGGGFPQDSISQELKFIIVSSGNVQPTWKLIQVSANTGNTPFFSMGRTRTHDLLMTIGPPTPRTTNDFLASQIGQAVTTGISQAVTNGVPAQ